MSNANHALHIGAYVVIVAATTAALLGHQNKPAPAPKPSPTVAPLATPSPSPSPTVKLPRY